LLSKSFQPSAKYSLPTFRLPSKTEGQWISDRELEKQKSLVFLWGVAAGAALLTSALILEPVTSTLEVSRHPNHSDIAAYICKNNGGWEAFSWSIRSKARVKYTCKDGTEIITTVTLI